MNDAFSQWLGIAVEEISEGKCVLSMTIRKEMTNGFGIAHGGITYSLADSALAFAANSHGRQSVSIDTSINHIEALKEGDKIIAIATENALKNKFGFYTIEIKKKKKQSHFSKEPCFEVKKSGYN
ncbi:PaaI family thioesterase [Flavobacterium piscinae]|uniref:PaaI family thioesterase n=1 Tax=Flavobacterium piscinae TaxID=2506424 RepID=UPI002AAC1346|nr:hotdog fold thioesterase [Flavobacterium piscinae]